MTDWFHRRTLSRFARSSGSTGAASSTRAAQGVLVVSVALAIPVGLTGCSTSPTVPLPTVASVDLARYAGQWYEAASLPNRFQAQCVAEVTNRCRRADGSVEAVTGVAKVVEGSANAKLRVSFFRPFYGDYWVLALAPDYRWALVGEPSRRFGWVLSRTPQIAPADLEAALARAETLGFARAAFKASPQTQPLD